MSALGATLSLLVVGLPMALDSGQLQEEATRAVVREHERIGRRMPQRDDRLQAAAAWLAREALTHGAEEAADPRSVSEAVSRAGGADAHPRALIVRGSPPEEALATFRQHPELAEEASSHVGVGSAMEGDRGVVVALFAQRRAELEPFPRQLPRPGDSRRLCGVLQPAYRSPEVYVTRPAGNVERVPATGERGGRFCTHLVFPRAGLHEVEVIARGPAGPEVAALFYVEVGPPQHRTARPREREPTEPQEARARIVERINALRGTHDTGALSADATLDAVAQAYAERMAREGFFAHVSPDGGDLRRRLTQAGYRYRGAGENLGFASGPLSAHRGIEQSPGHRRNLLTSTFTHVGVGVAWRKRGEQSDVVLVEVLATPLSATPAAGSGSPLGEVYRTLTQRREGARLPPLRRSEVLEQLATDHARRALRADTPTSELPDSTLHERVFQALPELGRVAVDIFIADNAADMPPSGNVLDRRNNRVGVGTARGDSSRYGKDRAWVVVIYAVEG